MGQHAALGRNFKPCNEFVEQSQQSADDGRIVARRIDADAGVARSEQQAVKDRGGDAPGIVEGMIGLQPRAHSPAHADGVAKGGKHFAFFRNQNEVLIAHQLGHRGGHFRGDPARQLRQRFTCRRIRKQEVAERPNREGRDRGEGRGVMAVDDQAGNLVVLEGNDGFLEELAERNVRQRHPRRDHLFGAVGGNSRQPIPGARRRCLGQEVAQVIEHIARGIDGMTIDHGGSATLRRSPERSQM